MIEVPVVTAGTKKKKLKIRKEGVAAGVKGKKARGDGPGTWAFLLERD